MSNAFEIGTSIIDPYGTKGFISNVMEPQTRGFVLTGGLHRVAHEYEICYENGRISVLPDGIVKPFVDRAAHLPKVDNVAERRAEIAAQQEAAQAAARKAADEARDRAAAFRQEAREKVPAWAKAAIVAELVADRSDSQSDYFGSTVVRTVILGFAKTTRDMFPEMRKFAATFEETEHLADAPESAEHREKYSMGAGFYLKQGGRNHDGWQVRKLTLYNGADSIPSGAEWHVATPSEEKASAPNAATKTDGIRIEEHRHTTKGFDMFIAILPDRVERDEFNRLLDAVKALGGWYSRPWNGTPGGFAFKDRAKAETFANGQPSTTVEKTAAPAADKPAPRVVPGMGDKLREMAERLQRDIDSKMKNRLTNTPKRRREADSARIEGYRLQRTQEGLRALAGLHDSGTVPAVLTKIISKAAVYELMGTIIDRSNAGYYDAGFDTGKPSHDTPEARALWALVQGQSEADKQKEVLRRKVDSLQFANIPGYFPTPADLVAEMIEAADIPEGQAVDVLEPEGGSGAILDGLKAARPLARFATYERHASLREVLTMKGYKLEGSDFLEAVAAPTFDYVLMNPPFENGQDMVHVRHAFDFLKEGGRLVAIMSPGPFFRSDRKAQEFRDWFENLAGDKTDIPAGAFKESGTGVATVMVTLRK